MKELIEKIENIKNYQEKIYFLLSDEVVESLKDSKYIFNLFRSESEYRKKLFLSNLNFYKAVSPIELYLYIELQTDISKYEYLCNENVVNYIAQFDNIGTIIEKMENIKLIKKLIKEIYTNNIQYISYSIDSLNNEKLQFLKGTKKIDIKEIDKAIYYCKENRNSCKNSTNIMGNKPRRL